MREYLGQELKVIIDRPMGFKNYIYGFYYPVNYGVIENIDFNGKQVEAYVIGEFRPLDQFIGQVIAVIHHVDDGEYKLVLTKECRSKSYSKEQIEAILEFQERLYHTEIIMA